MKKRLLEFLVCPKTKRPLKLETVEFDNEREEIKSGKLISPDGSIYPIINYIPRFVKTDDYTKSFSFQWKVHKTTQFSTDKNPFSEESFREISDLTPEKVRGKLILDAGCGSGRFLDILEKWGAEVIGVDLSYSVDSAQDVLGERKNAHLIQASIFELPLKKEIFDFVWSFGVLMATPSTEKAFKSLVPIVKTGGRLGIWIYSNYDKIHTLFSDLWRKITTRLPKPILYYLCFLSVPLYYVYKIPLIGHILRNIFIISMRKHWRWRVLETFDWYSPKYQWKHRYPEVFNWYKEAGFEIIHMGKTPIGMVGRKR